MAASKKKNAPAVRPGRGLEFDRKRMSDANDVARLQALLAHHHLERAAVARGQGAVALGEDRGVMDENVRTALTRDEPQTLLVVEPLDSSLLGHAVLLVACCWLVKRGSADGTVTAAVPLRVRERLRDRVGFRSGR